MKKFFYSYVAKMRVTYSLTTYSLLTFDSKTKISFNENYFVLCSLTRIFAQY